MVTDTGYGNPFRNRKVILRHGDIISMGDGDFTVLRPDNQRVWIRLRSGLPLFPLTSPEGKAPAEYVIRALETKSSLYAAGAYNELRRFCKFLVREEGVSAFSWRSLDEVLLLRYLNHLRSQGSEHHFWRVRHFYTWAAEDEYEGFSLKVSSKLATLRIPGGPKGVAVLTNDRYEGPLPDRAFRLILRRLSSEGVPLLPRVCASLCVELGANPAQFCQLRERDLLVYETDGEPIYQLDLPRSKKGDNYKGRRRRPLSPQLGKLLCSYVAETTDLRAALKMGDPFLLLNDLGRPMTDQSFNTALGRFADNSGLTKVVEGSLTARRFRRTFATRLVAEGAAREHLMDLLDHTDDQNVGVYYAMRGDAVRRIDAAVGPALEAITARFLGKIVSSEAEAILGDRPEQRVKASLSGGDVGIGTCGHNIRAEGLCRLHPPHACYTCPLFQPWRDADHRGLAATIQTKRDELVELEGGEEGGRVVGLLDGLLAAVEEVAQACETPEQPRRKRRRRRANGEGDHE